mgnify:CR=1 FL=1
MELDDDELKATRKMYGVDGGLYEGSDKNVGSIEEMNFKRELLQRPISYLTEENLDKLETHCLKAIRYEVGIEHKVVLELLERHKEYLAEFEQDKARIKELEEELEKANRQLDLDYVEENFIPKQQVKEGLEKIEDYFDRLNGPDEDMEYIRQVKNELLEGEK